MTVRGITAIFVCWGDTADFREAAAALAQARARIPPGGVAVSLVVVDNGGGGLHREEVESLWPGAVLLTNPSNLGLGPAVNQAARGAPGDVLLLLNPDTRAEGEPFSPIARVFEGNGRIVAIAPRLIEMDGKGAATAAGPLWLSPPGHEDQATFQLRRLPTLGADARELLLLDHLWPNNPWRRRARYADVDRAESFPVEQAAAAALAIRKDVFQRLGGFDERYVPAWHEDVDLCERLLNEGTIVYLPTALFRHRGGDSAARLGYARFLPIFYRNALLYRHSRYGTAARLVYRILLAKGMALRLMALPFRRDVPRSRGEAARAYLRVLRMALGLDPGNAQAAAQGA